jgi:uncharacterized protein YjbI with pentapeptide repeats
MAASQNTSWYTSFLKFLPKNNQDKKKKSSPSAKKIRCQLRGTLLITVLIVLGLSQVENRLKDETSADKIQPELNTKNPQIIEFITAYNQNEKRKEEEKQCKYKCDLLTWILCPLADSKLLGQVQNIGVISAAILFFWETFDRKKQLERQAWQLIDGAQGSETSGARKQAIEELCEEESNITGLDADGADLRGINLSDANLTRASFKNAILEEANFQGAILTEANFEGANLKGANFKKATLLGTIFTRSDLSALTKIDYGQRNWSFWQIYFVMWAGKSKRYSLMRYFSSNQRDPSIIKTDLRDANLGLAVFIEARLAEAIFGIDESATSNESQQPLGSKTKLIGAKFWDANLTKTNLKGVDISDARFGGAKVEPDIILNADKYTEAYYGKDFCDNNNFIKVDKRYDKYKKSQQSEAKELLKILQNFINKKSVDLSDEDAISDFLILLKFLKNFIKDSDNLDSVDNDLDDQILKTEDALKESLKSYQELSAQSEANQKLLQDGEDRYRGSQRLLEDLEEEN